MHQMVASYQGAKVMTFDLETNQCVMNLDSGSTYGEFVLAVLSPHQVWLVAKMLTRISFSVNNGGSHSKEGVASCSTHSWLTGTIYFVFMV